MDLEKQIEVLEARKKELSQEEEMREEVKKSRKEKKARLDKESDARKEKERQKAKALQDKDEMEYAREQEKREAKALKKKQRRLVEKEKRHRRREDQEDGDAQRSAAEEKDYQEYLSTLSDDDLKREMDERAKEFAKYRETLVSENVDEADRADLRNETEKSDLFLQKYKEAKDAKHSPEALERLEEVGEQNEVRGERDKHLLIPILTLVKGVFGGSGPGCQAQQGRQVEGKEQPAADGKGGAAD